MGMWQALTDFGDAAFVAAFALGITLWLGADARRRLVGSWIVLFGGALVLVVATKIAFIGWGLGIESLDFTGVSGHAVLASTIFPFAAHLLCLKASRAAHHAAVAAATLFATLIGVSRVIVGAHSDSEVVAGLVLGFAVAAAMIWMVRPDPTPRARAFGVVVFCLAVGLGAVSYGHRAHAQRWIVAVALKAAGRTRPYTRHDWPHHELSSGLPRG